MNLLNIFQEIEKVDPEFNERISPRRAAIRNMAGFGTKVALSAMPLALGSLLQKAYGQTQPDVKGVLNFALTLEYLESEFYTMGVAAPGLIPAGTADVAALTTIRDDESKHVAFLKSVLKEAAVAKPVFDFTAKGAFATVFTNYDTFLALAQSFEDTGVRAYKGQAPFLMGPANKDVLTAALNIHSVEARHASHIRQIRYARNPTAAPVLKPWITGNNAGGLPPAIYNGEELDTQGTVKISGISANGVTISANAATEAFDEPLSYGEVLAIAKMFIVA